jgi:uncharacterized protein YbjT (DUF2867 family)
MILITGASGMVGRAVLEEARKTDLSLKAMYREPAKAKVAPAGVTAVVADYADKESFSKALENVYAVFLVCSPISQLVQLESNAIEACAEKGVRHVVLISALGAHDYPKSFPSWHNKSEDKLKASGLSYTILRPNSLMQNLLTAVAPSVRAQGTFYAAMGNAQMSLLDVRDLAAAATKILLDPKDHAGKIYELNGPDALNYTDVAQRIARAVGKPVKFVDVPESKQQKSMLEQGLPEWLVTALMDLQRYYTVYAKGGEVTDTLPRLLGKPPITLSQFLEENKDSFREQAAGA